MVLLLSSLLVLLPSLLLLLPSLLLLLSSLLLLLLLQSITFQRGYVPVGMSESVSLCPPSLLPHVTMHTLQGHRLPQLRAHDGPHAHRAVGRRDHGE
jgi:hypothetical protein